MRRKAVEKHAAKTAEATKGGWLHTGDVGSMDPNGFIRLRGRLAERIIVAGEVWYPRDVEEAFVTDVAIRQAALVGIPDPVLGQRPVAYLTLHDGHTIDEVALLDEAGQVLGRDLHDILVVVVDELPMTPTGKIAKADLAARAAIELTAK